MNIRTEEKYKTMDEDGLRKEVRKIVRIAMYVEILNNDLRVREIAKRLRAALLSEPCDAKAIGSCIDNERMAQFEEEMKVIIEGRDADGRRIYDERSVTDPELYG